MAVETALAFVNRIFFAKTGKHLNDLENTIIKQVWQGKKYLTIAEEYSCTEGHIKDTAYQLWQVLSTALGEKITKTNFRSAIARQLEKEINISSESVNFLGRKNAIASLEALVKQGSKMILIQGKGGIGKTTLAREYLQQGNFEIILELLMAKETDNITSVERLIEEWLTKDFYTEAGREFGVSLSRLKRELVKRKVGVLIDNLEPVLDRNGNLIEPHRNYLELLRILSDRFVNSITIITSRDRLCEPSISLEHYRLPGLEVSAWQKYFSHYQIQGDRNTICKIHRNYGGNAKAMGIICGSVKEDFNRNIDLYWEENQGDILVERELKNLVTSQFDRLHKLDPEAYKILSRLGGYRYRDIATVSKDEILVLFWDIEAQKYPQIIRSLKNRSLIEHSANQYWLHPVIQAAARSRLQANNELERVHRYLGKLWTEKIVKITNLNDAIIAWEAYYHYLEIKDLAAASQVILNSRINQWGQYLPLGSTLYRMGLLQSVLTGISRIIDELKSQSDRAELNNILGDIYWITGRVKNAIAAQEKTINLANKSLENIKNKSPNQRELYYLKMLKIDSLLSIGFYQIDLWELEAAARSFKQVISLAQDTLHYRWAEKANICLALVNSYLNISEIKISGINRFYDSIVISNSSEYQGSFAYFMQIIAQIYINLGQEEKGLQICNKAIAFASQSNYNQVLGKSLITLAEIKRKEKQYKKAILNHQESIEILDRIGAKCDLANAYFQYGITLKIMGQVKESSKYFSDAIQLFTTMKAPKQIEKVKQFGLQRIQTE
ncbi:MAG: NB-ARC domain-containing protein [Prochloraceae cyanobacterium]|nr:NB-ARC domain-containing protein [Prochloraceae cyanobacterium]